MGKISCSKFQAGIHVTALRALGEIGAGLLGIEMIAADAVKSHAPAFGVVERPVAAVIVEPEKPKQAQHQQAIEHDIESEIRTRHSAEFTRSSGGAKGKDS